MSCDSGRLRRTRRASTLARSEVDVRLRAERRAAPPSSRASAPAARSPPRAPRPGSTNGARSRTRSRCGRSRRTRPRRAASRNGSTACRHRRRVEGARHVEEDRPQPIRRARPPAPPAGARRRPPARAGRGRCRWPARAPWSRASARGSPPASAPSSASIPCSAPAAAASAISSPRRTASSRPACGSSAPGGDERRELAERVAGERARLVDVPAARSAARAHPARRRSRRRWRAVRSGCSRSRARNGSSPVERDAALEQLRRGALARARACRGSGSPGRGTGRRCEPCAAALAPARRAMRPDRASHPPGRGAAARLRGPSMALRRDPEALRALDGVRAVARAELAVQRCSCAPSPCGG